MTYEPSDKYYGAKKYIEDGRYKQAQPFFEEDDEELVITEQAHEILNELAVATRNTKTKQHTSTFSVDTCEKIGLWGTGNFIST